MQEEAKEKKGSKISNVEWGLIIGALLVIDLVQIGLDLLAEIGVVINRFIDIVVGLSLGFYLQMRGQSLINPKRLFGLLATFIGEEIPDVDALPFWTLDGIFNMSISKSEEIMSKIPGGAVVATALETATGKNVSGDPRSIKQKIDDSRNQIRRANHAIKDRRNRIEQNDG
jgi:hypothetical protein